MRVLPNWLQPLAIALELLRDLLIFVPIAYTWWKIAGALTAYGTYTGDEPFLLAWQKGFGQGLEPLSTSATVVASVVALIILLTLLANVARELLDYVLRQSLTRSTTSVSAADLQMLSRAFASSSMDLQGALRKYSADITRAVDTGPGSKLHEMFEKWTAASTELKALGQRLQGTQETADQLTRAQADLRALVAQVGDRTTVLVNALTTERDLSRQEAHAHRQLANEVSRSTEALGQSLRELHVRTEDLNRMINSMVYVVQRLET